MAYDDETLVRDLRDAMKARKVSLRSMSERIDVPYRTMQNYMSGESRMPAIVLIKALDILGIDLRYLRYGDSLLRHEDLYDAVIRVFGDALADIDWRQLGKRSAHLHRDMDRHHTMQRNASEVAVRLSEAYDHYVRSASPHGQNLTIKEMREAKLRQGD